MTQVLTTVFARTPPWVWLILAVLAAVGHHNRPDA